MLHVRRTHVRKLGLVLLTLRGLTAQTPSSPCDVNTDGSVNIVDVQRVVNQSLGNSACTADLNKDGTCNVADVQLVITSALGGVCNASNVAVAVSVKPGAIALGPSAPQQFAATVT